MALLEMKNIRKSFGDLEVIRDISLRVDEGEVLSIIGPSGSGKSTMLRCAAMLETIDSGEIWYMGERVAWADGHGGLHYPKKAELKKVRSCFGLVFQKFMRGEAFGDGEEVKLTINKFITLITNRVEDKL